MRKKKKQSWFIPVLCILTLLFSTFRDYLHAQYLFSSVGSNVVYVQSPEGAKHMGSATAFEVVAPSGRVYTLTNQHVCELNKDGYLLVAEKRHSQRFIPIKILEVYEDNDLCLLEGLAGYEGLKLADKPDIGDTEYALGYPLGEALNMSSGHIKASQEIWIPEFDINPDLCTGKWLKPRELNTFFGVIVICTRTRPSIATNIPIHPGNSGSPMFNAFGNVTGVIFASSNETHWGYAVGLDDVKKFLSAY
jgi:S1-C subfamily serine protease